MKKYMYLILILIIVAVIGIFINKYGSTYAKYVSDSVWNYYLKSKGFYIHSDYLDTDPVSNVNNLWNGESIHFNLSNSLNQNVISGYDIQYTISCDILGEASSYTECHLNGTTSNIGDGVLSSSQICVNKTGNGVNVSSYTEEECNMGGYSWDYQVAEKDLYFDVILTDSSYTANDVLVKITVSTTSPYSKILIGEFKLHKINDVNQSITMNYKNYSNYGRLIITNSYLTNKCITISWDSDKLLIDSNDNDFISYEMSSNGYINKIKLNINPQKNISYIFYKKDKTAVYNVSEFNLEELESC